MTEPRWGAPSKYLGLNYGSCEAGLRLAGIEMTPELWAEVQTIEKGAIEALNRN